ncbi:hypothetical protein D3C87_2153070 [compost metagenome]
MMHIDLQDMAFVLHTHQPDPDQRSLLQPERLHKTLQCLFDSGPRQIGICDG